MSGRLWSRAIQVLASFLREITRLFEILIILIIITIIIIIIVIVIIIIIILIQILLNCF